jgi:hypothetical protein
VKYELVLNFIIFYVCREVQPEQKPLVSRLPLMPQEGYAGPQQESTDPERSVWYSLNI